MLVRLVRLLTYYGCEVCWSWLLVVRLELFLWDLRELVVLQVVIKSFLDLILAPQILEFEVLLL